MTQQGYRVILRSARPNTIELKVKQEYSSLVPPLTVEDFEKLKKSIQKHGQWHPIVINQDKVILDGHHRYRACKELYIVPKTEVLTFESELEEKLYVIDNVIERRHLNTFQKVELELTKKPILEEIARQNMLSGVTLDLIKSRVPVDTNKEIGKRAGCGKDTVRKVEFILEKAREDEKKKLRSGQWPINKVYSHIKRDEKREELINSKPVIELPNGCELIFGDCLEKSKQIPNNSVDLIFTDPPYGLESIPLYKNLGEIASRVLKPGGSLVTFVGQYTLPQIIKNLEISGLNYWWPFCVKHGGAHQAMHNINVFVEWKPLLWYVKGDKANTVEYISDFIQSEQPDKVAHEWEQSVIEANHVISKLTVENQIVLDPFMGGGTFGIATLRLKRKFIGIEIDKGRFEIAKNRIALELQK